MENHSPTAGAATVPHVPRIAVLLPCYNEEVTIGSVVADFRSALPQAAIHVFDNNSDDDTALCARQAGAVVHAVALQGKGNVVRRMFADVDADIYVMADGDGTYPAAHASELVAAVQGGVDMVVGARVHSDDKAYRRGHVIGNRLLNGCVALLFGRHFDDLLSGYRAFSRRYAKSFPAHAQGFDVETELAVHALQLRMPVKELAMEYLARPEGSTSKLSTYRDGLRILAMIVRLWRNERPASFYGLSALAFALVATGLFIPIALTYLQTGLVPRFPTLIVSAALAMIATVLWACGLILETVTRGRVEQKHQAYLSIAPTHRVR